MKPNMCRICGSAHRGVDHIWKDDVNKVVNKPVNKPANTIVPVNTLVNTHEAWQSVALSFGEMLGSTGPADYYSMTPAAWFSWANQALDQLRPKPKKDRPTYMREYMKARRAKEA
jgi:hypothetical protein